MILWIATALAGGFEVADQGAIAAGTGHAGLAREADAAAAWSDPAALADASGLRVGIGAAIAVSRIEAAGDGWEGRSEAVPGTPPHLYASYAKGAWVGGVAVNVPFGGGVRWPADGAQRFEIVESRPTVFRIAPFGGGRIGRVAVAAGPHVDVASLYVDKATDHVSEEGRAQLLLRGVGVGVDASVHVRASDTVTLGAAYKSRTRVQLRGDADFDVPAAFASTWPDQDVAATWDLPDRLTAGVAIVVGRAQLVADAGVTTWAVNDALAFDFADPATPDLVQKNDWRTSAVLRAGASLDAGPATFRAGAYADGLPAPVPTETLSPSSPDATRIGLTAGAGVAVGFVRFDAFYEHVRLLGRTATGPDAPLASYRGVAHVAGLDVSFATTRFIERVHGSSQP